MTTYTYDDILKRVESNGALNITNSANTSTVSVEFQIPQLQPIDFPMKDLDYESSFTTKEQDIAKVLSITQDSLGFTNTYTNSPQILINSDRVVINTKSDYLMLFGGAGVAISSKNPVNLDSDSSITMAANEGLFLGVPNKGVTPWPKIAQPKTKGDPTPDQAYEPLALGIKLANILEDLLVILKNARIATPAGLAYFREDAQYDFANIQARLPEMLSTAVFIDGISHESTDPAPSPPTTITNPTGLISGTGTFSGNYGGGAGGATPKQVMTAADKDYNVVVATVIDKLEGGYWSDRWYRDPDLGKNMGWTFTTLYKDSGETMMGIDRKAGAPSSAGAEDPKSSPAGRQFWALIDGANASTTWKWGYLGGPLQSQLRTLAGEIIRPLYKSLAATHFNPATRQIVENDGRLYFHMVYAVWNGSDWFRKFANALDKAVTEGNTNPDQLCRVAIQSRLDQRHPLVRDQAWKIAELIGVPMRDRRTIL